jgi:addiction module HigA family antidote
VAEELPSTSPIRPAALRLVRHPQRRHRLDLGPLTDEERAELLRDEAELRAAGLLDRPKTRADCIDGPRPCPWIGCRQHMYATILPSGAIKPDHPDREVWEMTETCSLDLADRHADVGMEATEIAALLGVTDSSVRMHLNSGLEALRRRLDRRPRRVPPASLSVAAEPEQATPPATAATGPATEPSLTVAPLLPTAPEAETAPHPGVVLRRYIVERGLSQGGLARQLGRSPALVHHIISGRNPMTASTAWMLSRVFGTEPRFWMDLQVAYDLARARPGVSPAAGAAQ